MRNLASRALAFFRDDRGAAMLFAGIALVFGTFAFGGELVNIAWRESHREEVRAAARAALTTVPAALLGRAGDGGTADAAIADHVERFVEAMVDVDVSDLSVDYNDGRIGVGFDAALNNYADVWPVSWFGSFGGGFEEEVAVRFDSTQHEFAVALDFSTSMLYRFPSADPNPANTRLKALQDAMRLVADNMEAAQRDSPDGMMVSLVPFDTAVRIADVSGAAETEEKRRYLAMMGGRAKAKWVDMFHHYGAGATAERAVGAGWDWDEDYFSGCFMARWGAYWDPLARPTPLSWPALDADGYPLHLSDAPPDPNDSNTLFFPYSWPDAGVADNIDTRIQFALGHVLGGSGSAPATPQWREDNTWTLPQGGGHANCPSVAVTPLRQDVAALRAAIDAFTVDFDRINYGTYIHLGVVWALRALSAEGAGTPLSRWQEIWGSRDSRNNPRPSTGGDVKKVMLVISDGTNHPGSLTPGPLKPPWFGGQPDIAPTPGCSAHGGHVYRNWFNSSGYNAAAGKSDADFNAQVNANASWRTDFAVALGDPSLALSLVGLEPVDVFRGRSAAFGDALVNAGLPRPMLVDRRLCDLYTMFTPYGRYGDALYVDGTPRLGQAPLLGSETATGTVDLFWKMSAQLDDWMVQACRIAAARGVRVHAVYIADNNTWPENVRAMNALRRCTDAGGGELILTPDPATLNSALARLTRLTRKLSFVD